ncbi:MAG: hypothetical protein GX241_01910 [Ruminococcaceae bacterium]|nr:hypothetical protein [Oscillospiraceae bacterium]
MKRFFKNVVVAMLIFTVLFSFFGCSAETKINETALVINDVKINVDVFSYYLDEVMKGTDLEKSEAIKLAEEKCADYVKYNTEFKELGLSLSSSNKADVSLTVNDLWGVYSGYYKKIGVSKETLTKVKESEAFRQAIIEKIYGEDGEKAISKEEKETYFEENYVFFKVISAYLCTVNDKGETVPLDDDEITAIKGQFADMKAKIKGDVTIDAVNLEYVTSLGGSTEAELPILSTSKKSETFPEPFFEEVKALEKDAISVLAYDKYIFLVQKKDGAEYYSDNAAMILSEMATKEFEKYMADKYSGVKIISTDMVEKECYDTIKGIKNAKTKAKEN